MGTEDSEKIICDKCNGEGMVYEHFDNTDPFDKEGYYLGEICPKCLGHRKLDWIEYILGKQPSKFTENDFFKQEYHADFTDINIGKGRK